MTDVTTNPDSGSESARASLTLDEAARLDFDEPNASKDVANDKPVEEEEQEDNQDEAQAQEPDETSDDADSEEPNDAESDEANEAVDDQPVHTLPSGEKVSTKELISGYMKEKDYRLKSQIVAHKGKELDALTARVTHTVDALANYLASQLPDEPTQALAVQNPSEYVRQKAIYDAALGQIQMILNAGAEPKQIADALSEEATESKLAEENAALIAAFPELTKPEARDKFFSDAFRAGEELGFTQQEMAGFTDHRYLKVMHWALKGMQAEKARSKAMAKVENAPPITPATKAKSPAAAQARKNQDAMKRLAKTGSIKDALLVDFD